MPAAKQAHDLHAVRHGGVVERRERRDVMPKDGVRQRNASPGPGQERLHCAGIVQVVMQDEGPQRCLDGRGVAHQLDDVAERNGRSEALAGQEP